MPAMTRAQSHLVREWRRERPANEFRELAAGAAAMNGLTEEALMAEAERTALEFQATLKDVKVDIPKEQSNGFGYSGRSKPNGGILLTLRIDRPKQPAQPQLPYALKEPYGDLSVKAIGPEPTRKKKGETDEEFEARKQQHAKQLERRDRAFDRHNAELEEWRRKQAQWGDVLRAYASITGLAAAFGDSPIQVSLTPLQTDFFAGMGVLSLPSPDQEAVSGPFDDEDEDDEPETLAEERAAEAAALEADDEELEARAV